jgi:arabinogalactan oligomer/maltooligosaccharide transport system substrate-binding protein
MKRILTLVVLLIATFSLAACVVETGGFEYNFDQTQQKTQTIKVWLDDENANYMNGVIAEFRKVHPEIIVQFQHMSTVDARERLKVYGKSGNGADIFQFPHDHLAKALQEDLVYPIPTATATALAQRVHPMGIEIGTVCYDETSKSLICTATSTPRLYGVAISLESVALFYNKDLVTTPATTIEQIVTEAAAYVAVNDPVTGQPRWYFGVTAGGWHDSYFVQFIYSAFNWRPFGVNGNDPSAVGFAGLNNALAWMVGTLKPVVTKTGNTDSVQGGSLFEQGKLHYAIGGPWNIEAYKTAGLNFGVTTIPTLNGNATKTYAGAQMVAVYKHSPNKEAALKFVEFLTTDTAQTIHYEQKGKLPALKNDLLGNVPGVSSDAYLAGIIAQLATSVPMPTIPEVQYYWGPGEAMLKQVWNDGVVPATATATAEAGYLARLGLGQ